MEGVKEKVRLQKYPAYKDSEVEWLGEIPENWEVEKGKWLFNKEDRPTRIEDDVVTCFRDGEVTLRSNRRTDGFTNSIKEHGYQGIRKGDLVIHAMDAFAGAIGVSDSNGKSTPVYSACTPRLQNDVDPSYYAYLLRNLALTGFIESLAKGIRERSTDFRYKDFSELILPKPDFQEQTAIASFLDEKCGKIDTAIEQKQKLIELLKERKQIIIQNAVTKGLDLNVKLKDSGVEWIGEIPEHWEVKKFKFLANITTGGKNTEDKAENGKYPFYVRSQTPERINGYSFDGEAILTAGDGAGVGKVFHYVNEKFDFHQRVYRFSNFRNILGKLLFYYLKSNFAQVALNGEAKSTVDSLRLPLIQNFSVTIPSSSEQSQIVEYIERQSGKIEKAIALQQRQIEKLKEYKSSLIDAAVTGKIKVS